MDQQQINDCLQQALQPDYLDVQNESHMHSSGKGANSHFRIVIVAQAFEGVRAIARHQRIYQILNQGYNGIHALAIHAYTKEEWLQKKQLAPVSPNCLGHGR